MEAKELMIGDWVNVFGIPKQMEGIREFRNGDEVVYYDGDNGNFIENVTPIPLTPEILENNGFEFDGDNIYKLGDYQMVIEYSCGFLFGWVFCHKKQLNYVHELQHALKLCGIEKEIIL